MQTLTKQAVLNIVICLWGIGCLIGLASTVMLFFRWKRDDVASGELCLTGTFIYRNLPKFIKREYIKHFRFLTYLAISFFLAGVIVILYGVFVFTI
jgi:beta-lactamase regulating signal transducer with metallopeptidase domain